METYCIYFSLKFSPTHASNQELKFIAFNAPIRITSPSLYVFQLVSFQLTPCDVAHSKAPDQRAGGATKGTNCSWGRLPSQHLLSPLHRYCESFVKGEKLFCVELNARKAEVLC